MNDQFHKTSYIPLTFRSLEGIVRQKEFLQNQLKLPLVLGYDHSSLKPKIVDLKNTGHILIVGGKNQYLCCQTTTLSLKYMLTSLLFRHNKTPLQFVLMDRRERGRNFDAYSSLPYLEFPIAHQPEEIYLTLEKCVEEMLQRHNLLKSLHIKDIDEFNATQWNPLTNHEFFHNGVQKKFPYIVIAIDHVSDLLSSENKKDIEPLILQLLQLGRQVGIHLILVTHTLDNKIFDPILTLNCSIRICFSILYGKDEKTLPCVQSSGGIWYSFSTREQILPIRMIPYLTDDQISWLAIYLKNQEVANNLENLVLRARELHHTKGSVNLPKINLFD